MAKFKVDQATLDEYFYAKHAAERNQHMASINEDMPNGDSGMSDQKVRRTGQTGVRHERCQLRKCRHHCRMGRL